MSKKTNKKLSVFKNSDFFVSVRRHCTDDCMDAGGRAMPGAIAENRVKSAFLEVPR